MEPVVFTRATKEPLTPAEEKAMKLDGLLRTHADLEREAHEACERIKNAEAHHRAIGAELTRVRQQIADLTAK